ncbi:MAG: hypothetical protein KKH51_12125 [Actinobacteria bacterium]|nr:hypothetical protein [Actinomycetota bacterium]
MSIIMIAVAAVGLVFAILAQGARRHWLVIGSAVVVAAAVVASVAVPPAGQPTWAAVAIGIVFSAIGVLGGSPVVALVLRFAQGGVELGDHGGIVVDDDAPHGREILRGGATIGYLERFALIGAVIAGQAAAVALIIAIKGLGRFSELDDSRARERFIIGTLTSLCWAGACVAAAIIAS